MRVQLALDGQPAPTATTPAARSRVPCCVRVCWLADSDELCFADSSPMPQWRAVKLVERVSRSDHELLAVEWFQASRIPPDPDGCRRAEMPRGARVELLAVVPTPEETDVNEARRLLRSLLAVTRGPIRQTIEAAIGLLGTP